MPRKRNGDRIYGRAARVIDGDTLEVHVTRRASGNQHEYDDKERVRVANKNAPEKGVRGARAATAALRKRVQNRGLRLDVQARDKYGRLIARVTKTPKKR